MNLSLLLDFYVKRESIEEKNFIKEQKKYNVKLCVKVSHINCSSTNGAPDLLIIHTKLNQIKDEGKNIFFIRSQKISHSKEVVQNTDNDNCKVISIETAITKNGSQCETIFKTFVTRLQDGKKTRTQMSYTRQIVECLHSDGHNSEKNYYSYIFSDNENDNPEKCLHSNQNESPVVESSPLPPPKIKKKRSFKKSKTKDNSDPVYKKTRLFPIKKKKSNLELPNPILKNESHNTVTPVLGNRKLSLANFSTENEKMEQKKPTNISARICISKKTQKFEFIEDDIAFMDEENDDYTDVSDTKKSEHHSDSYIHFDFCTVNDCKQEKNNPFEGDECTCKKRRLSAIANFINSKIYKKSELNNDTEIKKYNNKTGHYIDCSQLSSLSSPEYLSPISSSSRILSSSQNSVFLYNKEQSVSNLLSIPENELSRQRKNIFMNSIEQLDKLLDNLKKFNEVQCSLEHVKYFKNVQTYDKYQKAMQNILRHNESLDKLIMFLYSIRIIIQQIDDPCISENENIKRIFDFSHQFIDECFGSDIQKHRGLENFIFHHDDLD